MTTASENPAAYDSLSHDGLRRPSMGKCFLQWFWPAWMIDGAKPHDTTDPSRTQHNYPQTSSCSRKTSRESASSQRPGTQTQEQSLADTDEENPACKACRTWGVSCDRQRPRCSHCLDQQILCFYVAPLRKTMKKSSKSRSSRTQTEAPLRLQESCC